MDVPMKILIFFFHRSPVCEHGECIDGAEAGCDNFCICETGWQSAGCDSWIPYSSEYNVVTVL